jgi:hypothetical protein
MSQSSARKGNRHTVSIGEEYIQELVKRGDVSIDRSGRVYGINSFIKRTLEGRK